MVRTAVFAVLTSTVVFGHPDSVGQIDEDNKSPAYFLGEDGDSCSSACTKQGKLQCDAGALALAAKSVGTCKGIIESLGKTPTRGGLYHEDNSGCSYIADKTSWYQVNRKDADPGCDVKTPYRQRVCACQSNPPGNCGHKAYVYCCHAGTPCNCAEGSDFPGQCAKDPFLYCCHFGTPCDCSKPVTNATKLPLTGETPVAKGTQTELPATDETFVTSGFDWEAGYRPSAFQSLSECGANSVSACLKKIQASESTMYTNLVTSRSEHSDLISSITTAEGGGFGVHMSASAEVMKQTHSSELSVSCFLGRSGATEREYVENPTELKLTSGAKKDLQRDPAKFLQTYGPHYVYSVRKGGSFLGHFTVEERTMSSNVDLQFAAKVDVKVLFVKATVSEKFQKDAAKASSRLAQTTFLKTRGGESPRKQASSPYDMGELFSKWADSVKTDPAPLTATMRSWMDSADVQEIVSGMSTEIQDMFNVEPVTPVTWDVLTEEAGKLMVLTFSLTQALNWPYAIHNSSIRGILHHLQERARAHEEDLETLTEASLLIRQAEIKNSDYKWFIADSLLDEYEGLRNEVQHLGPAGGVYYITLTGGEKGFYGDMKDWQLTCQRYLPHDVRDSVSSFAFVLSPKPEPEIKHEGNRVLLSRGANGTYKIMCHGGDAEGHGTAAKMMGWTLDIQTNTPWDGRSKDSAYVNFHEDDGRSRNKNNNWFFEPAANGQYKISLTGPKEEVGPKDEVDTFGWWLSVFLEQPRDTRDDHSAYVGATNASLSNNLFTLVPVTSGLYEEGQIVL